MEDWILDDLLECSVCLERLDTSSKVLPCQHTFCKKCLEEISRTHNELRCPECRILVETNIDDLPPNVLLMRILEGIRNVGPDHSSNKQQSQSTHSTDQHPSHNPRSPQIEKPCNKVHHQPCAKAIYDYFSNEPGDLSFKKGEIINLRKKVDLNWYRGDINGRVGVFPANYVQVIEPLPSQVPQCKALYDFKMANDEEEGCLAFNKGEVITVIRRVDENWAEGKLNNRIGIFPIAFVELNSVARALMKLSIEAQPGPSRVVPPTPTLKEESFAIPSVTHQLAGSTQAPNIFPPIVTSSLPTSDSSSTSLTSPSSTSNSTTPTTSSTSSHTSPSSPSHANPVSPTFGPVKRHSFGSTLPNGTKTSTKRHSAEILSNQDSSNEPRSLPVDVTLAQNHQTTTHLERTGSQRLKRNSEAVPPIPGPQVQHSSLLLPAFPKTEVNGAEMLNILQDEEPVDERLQDYTSSYLPPISSIHQSTPVQSPYGNTSPCGSSPQSPTSPTSVGRVMNSSADHNNYFRQANALHHHFEQICMDDSSQIRTPDPGYYSTSPLNNPYNRVAQANTSPNTPSSIPDIVLTDFSNSEELSMSKDFGVNMTLDSDLFPSDECLREGLVPVDLDELQMLNNCPDMIADPATEDHLRLDRL